MIRQADELVKSLEKAMERPIGRHTERSRTSGQTLNAAYVTFYDAIKAGHKMISI